MPETPGFGTPGRRTGHGWTGWTWGADRRYNLSLLNTASGSMRISVMMCRQIPRT